MTFSQVVSLGSTASGYLSLLLHISPSLPKTLQWAEQIYGFWNESMHTLNQKVEADTVLKDCVWPTHLVCQDSDFLFLGGPIISSFGWLRLKHLDPLAWQVLTVQRLYGFHRWFFVCVLGITVVATYSRGQGNERITVCKLQTHSLASK